MLRISFRNIFRHKWQSVLIFMVVMFSIIVRLFSDGAILSFHSRLEDIIPRSLSGDWVLTVYPEYVKLSSMSAVKPKPLPADKTQSLLDLNSVIISPLVRVGAVNYNEKKSEWNFLFTEGIKPQRHKKLIDYLSVSKGRMLKSEGFEIMISESTASNLNLGLGDKMLIYFKNKDGFSIPYEFKIVGLYHTKINTVLKQSDWMCYVPATTLQKIIGFKTNQYTDIVFRNLRPGLEKKVSTFAINHGVYFFKGIDLTSFGKGVDEFIGTVNTIAQIILIMVLVVSLVFVTFSTLMNRRKEIATMLAMGMKGHDMQKMILTEYAILCGTAFLFSVSVFYLYTLIPGAKGLGLFVSGTFDKWFADGKARVLFDWKSVWQSLIMLFITVLFSVWIPSRQIAKLDVIQSLREE